MSPHVSQHDKESDKTPVAPMDFAYFSSPEAPATSTAHDFPVPIMYCRQTRMVFVHLLPTESVAEYSIGIVLGVLRLLGYKRVIVKTDQELSVLLLARKAAEQYDGVVIPEMSPTYQPTSNREVERQVQQVTGLGRTIKDFVEERWGAPMEPRSALLPWMVSHCTFLLNTFSSNGGDDGLTPWLRWKGREFKIGLPPFGEAVMYHRRTSSKLEAQWKKGSS